MMKPPPDAIDQAIGARLRAYRRYAGLSQSKVAAALGVTFQQIQKYENGKNRLSGSRVVGIARLLKITPERLLGFDQEIFVKDDPIIALYDKSVADLVAMLSRLTPTRRKAVVQALRVIVEAFT
jgi:transcriptional regulator with XRE-family HTH domain